MLAATMGGMAVIGFADATTRRWRKRWMTYFALAGLATAIISYFACWAELNSVIAETEAVDPNWRLADLEAGRARIPDAENSALVILAAYPLIATGSVEAWSILSDFMDDLLAQPARRLDAARTAEINNALVGYQRMLTEYRKIASMPRGRYPLGQRDNPLETQPKHDALNRCRHAVEASLVAHIEAGDTKAAVEHILMSSNCARSIGDEPITISLMRRSTEKTCRGVERLLAQLPLDDAVLGGLQNMLQSRDDEGGLRYVLCAERAFQYERFICTVNQSRIFAIRPEYGFLDGLFIFFPGQVDHRQAMYLRQLNDLVRIAESPSEARLALANAWVERMKMEGTFMSGLGAGTIPGIIKFDLKDHARSRCTITALAAERYRLRTGKWPDELQKLVDAMLLTKVPIDPFFGQPLQWKPWEQGWQAYSVGVNRTDDGGDFPMKFRVGDDVGIRLYDPDKRRQPAANGP